MSLTKEMRRCFLGKLEAREQEVMSEQMLADIRKQQRDMDSDYEEPDEGKKKKGLIVFPDYQSCLTLLSDEEMA
jgi:hypothetical protein